MANTRKKAAAWSSVVVMTAASIGCTVPTPPVTTVWQRLGVPQAAVGIRDGVTNRSGNHPGLERKPPLLRIADLANLQSEIPAIKAAAEIKMAEDLAPQKIKALKYLATIGCGCYDKDGKIEEALLDALKDCTDEVRIEAANAVAEAAGTCGCQYDGCTPTCCKPSIVKRLYDMAYEVDAEGCPIEPSPEVRAAAARAVSACSAVPQLAAIAAGEVIPPPDPVPASPEALPVPAEPVPPVNPEALPPPDVNDVVPPPPPTPATAAAPAPETEGFTVLTSVEMGPAPLTGPASLISPASQPIPGPVTQPATEPVTQPVPEPVADSVAEEIAEADVMAVSAPENMVVAHLVERPSSERMIVRFDEIYDLNPGDSLLALSTDGLSTIATVLSVEGSAVEIDSADFQKLKLAPSAPIFFGLLDD